MKTWRFLSLAIILSFSFAADNLPAQGKAKRERVFDSPTGEVDLGGNIDQEDLILRGKLGKLVIEGRIDHHSTLDCTGLEVGAVVIGDKIDGQSHVLLNVIGDVRIGGKIGGQSQVTVSNCRDFICKGRIEGIGTVVNVTYRRDFKIEGTDHYSTIIKQKSDRGAPSE